MDQDDIIVDQPNEARAEPSTGASAHMCVSERAQATSHGPDGWRR
jgi:hypothetical protein